MFKQNAMEAERVFRLEQRPQEFLPTSLNCIQFQHLHLICRPHGAVCRRCKWAVAYGMPAMPHVKSRITIGRMQTSKSEIMAFWHSPICFAESPLLHPELRERHVPATPGESRFAQPEVPLPISNRIGEDPL